MRFMTLISNLICLNILWLVGCIPVITAGASTVAMYTVLLKYVDGGDDAVFKPFLRAFFEGVRKVTMLWIINLLIGAAMLAGTVYLLNDTNLWLKCIFGGLLFIYGAATSYLYPLLARYQNKSSNMIFNAFALSTRHILSSVFVVTLNVTPVLLLIFFPEIFMKMFLVWILMGFSLIAYLNIKILLPTFKKYELPAE